MRKLTYSLIVAAMAALLGGCHEVVEYADNPEGNFEQLWQLLDEHYCFFEQKGVDWNAVHSAYRSRIAMNMSDQELFDVCAQMLDELRDGHVNLSSPFAASYYRKWWSDYPQNYNSRLVEEYYFNFNYRSCGGIDYGILPQNVGYMRYGSFSSGIGAGNLDLILGYMATCSGLIIDVRDNGGGSVDNIPTLVGRFIDKPLTGCTICHKTGPGHGEFSEPYPITYEPAEAGRMMWLDKPVVVLCNRSTYSAANLFVAVMKVIPNVTVVGATTGGGSGMPFSAELPNGWGVRFSASPVTDPNGRITEFGVDPSPGCAIDLDPADAIQGHDTILDFAIALLTGA